MANLKEKALEISKKFPFSQYESSAHAANELDAGGKVSSCDNHLDEDFMKLLEDRAHLDVSLVPL